MAGEVWSDADVSRPDLADSEVGVSVEFDTELLAERRVRSGHSTLSLAGHLGVSVATVRAVEGGADPARYEYGLLCRYAEALGLEVPQMFRATVVCTDGPDVGDDAAHVVAVIVAAGGVVQIDQLAEALEWPPQRVRVALDDAAKLLPGVGLRLVWLRRRSREAAR
jgi:transcriptional regulator with XRE-family HTH domain